MAGRTDIAPGPQGTGSRPDPETNGTRRPEPTGQPRPEPTGRTAPAATPARPADRPSAPRRTGAPAETAAETTFRLRPIRDAAPAQPATVAPGDPTHHVRSAPLPPMRPMPAPSAGNGHGASDPAFSPDPSLSWSAPVAPGSGRPVVSFGEPEGYDEQARPRPLGMRLRPRIAVAAACVVLGIGLIGGAVTGSWLVGEPGGDSAQDTFAAAGTLWHSVPVDQLFPPTVSGRGAGPGGADRTWTRIAVAPDSGCAGAFDPLLRKALAPVGCERVLRATYIDATQSHVTTVGLLFTKADATAMRSLDARFGKEGLDRRTDLMPRPYAAKGTQAAAFGDEQRASWTISVLTDAPVVVFAVSGWADHRTVDDPQPAEEAMDPGATTAVAQSGLGHEAQGLADRVERALRKNVGPSREQSS